MSMWHKINRSFHSPFKGGVLFEGYIAYSITSTTRQQMMETGKRPRPNQAAMMPSAKAIAPASGDDVASVMAGKVITARVTYGT